LPRLILSPRKWGSKSPSEMMGFLFFKEEGYG